MLVFARMAILELQDIEFNYGDKELYRKVCLKMNPGEHCGLVGINGSGKSTLFSLITGALRPDKGKVIWQDHVTYSYLDQQLTVNTDEDTLSFLYGVYSDLFLKEKQMEKLYEQAASGEGDFDRLIAKASRLGEELNLAGFYSLQEKVGRIIDGLGLLPYDLERPMKEISGGQRAKVFLGKMLLEEHDVLLMDEPTNFLDAKQVEWLTSYLRSYPGAFLLISHDQAFLKGCVDVVFALENQTIIRYKGDFDHYLVQRELDRAQYEKNYNAQQRYIKKEKDFIAAHIVRATSAKAAKSRRTRLSHLDVLAAPKKEGGDVHFRFPFSHQVGAKPLVVEELSIGYSEPLLAPISLTLRQGEKVAIIGKNGIGKTTFLRSILGEIRVFGGDFSFLKGTQIGYYGQDVRVDLRLTPFEYVASVYPDLDKTQVRTLLGRFGVRSDLALRPMNELSGGEITKTRLAILGNKPTNFLILDEPTNHLDQKAKDSLFQAIEEYEGCVILVSHEKDFYDGLLDYEIVFS